MMSSHGSITAMLELLQEGDEDAAQGLWQVYFPRLVALARKRLGSLPRRVADEEDVALSALDCFCRHAREGRFPALQDRDNLWALLTQITARKALDLANHHRRQKRGGGQVRGDSALVAPCDNDVTGFDGIEADDPLSEMAVQFAEEFQRLLGQLRTPQLRCVAVWKMEGYTNVEIAGKADCSLATVERQLQLIRRLLEKR